MEKKDFGKTSQGNAATLYTIENDFLKLSLTDYGASVVSVELKKDGRDVVKGFEDVSGYQEGVQYMGATVGRVCNRIAKGTFTLDGKTYHVPINNGPNSLHGGPVGFSEKMWTVEMQADRLICRLHSDDQEMGFPGNLEITATYQLLSDGFSFTYQATSDADTYCNCTNHSFFNLEGLTSNTIADHWMQCDAKSYAEIDCDGCTTGTILSTINTPFDFKEKKRFQDQLKLVDPQLELGHGFDHHFCIDGDGMRKMLVCGCKDLTMEIDSDCPGFQCYSGNFLGNNVAGGKKNTPFGKQSTLSFETQYCPNAMNFEGQRRPLLKKGDTMKHCTEYHFSWKGDSQ